MSEQQTCQGHRKDGQPCREDKGLDEQGLCWRHRAQTTQRGLTNKQEAFICEYVKDLNGTQAAIRAGYSEATAASIAHENLRKPDIRARIDEILEEQRLSAGELISMLQSHATAGMAPFLRVVEEEDEEGNVHLEMVVDLTSDIAQAHYHLIKELRFDQHGQPIIKLHDAQSAMVHLAKIAGLFIDKVEHEFRERAELRRFLDGWNDMNVEERVDAMRRTLH